MVRCRTLSPSRICTHKFAECTVKMHKIDNFLYYVMVFEITPDLCRSIILKKVSSMEIGNANNSLV